MRGFASRGISQTITIKNYGTIKTSNGGYLSGNGSSQNAAHFVFEASNNSITLKNYKIMIIESQSEFNTFTGYPNRTDNKNSHLIFYINTDKTSTITFGDNSNIMLDFSGDFELNKEYKIAKLVTDISGNPINDLDIKSHLALSDEIKDLYSLTNSGDSFIIRLMNKIQETPITAIYKANIRTMNNFYTMSNSMIYPRKLQKSQNLGISSLRDLPTANRGNPFIKKSLDSAISLKSYESFAYRNESINRRIQRQNKRNYNRRLPTQSNSQNLKENQRDSQNLKADSANKTNQTNSSLRADSQNLRGNPQNQSTSQTQRNLQNQTFSQNLSQTPHDYYFILTPFFNYNSFAKSGNYNLRGFDYGFLTAFSAQVAESNHLGAHFIMSYGSLGDKQDKDLSIKSLNLNLGINYKLDLIWDMYLKARGDFYYFLNQVKTLTMFEAIKPNNLGFGVSVAYGKDFDFKSGGILGIEAGIDYKALKTNEVSLNSQTYKQSLLNLIYADLGMNYNKYFGGFGINFGGGFKANLAPKLAESILILNSQNLRFVLDNDKYLAYANAGISYLLNTKNFDIEFSLAYYGNFGDRVISNGGGVEWRVVW